MLDIIKEKKRLATVLIVALLGGMTGLCLIIFTQFLDTEFNQEDIEKIGVITPRSIPSVNPDDLQKKEDGNISINYTDKAQAELEVVEYILSNEELRSIFINDEVGRINFYIVPNTTINRIRDSRPEEDVNTLDTGEIIASGNYIYLPEEFSRAVPDAKSAYQNLFAGLYYAKLFNELKVSDLQTFLDAGEIYTLNGLEAIQEYRGLSEEDITGDWENPYPQKVEEYQDYASVCANITEAEHLLICELSIYQTPNSSKLVPNSLKYFNETEIVSSQMEMKVIGVTSAKDFTDMFKELDLSGSKIKFTDWQLPVFSSEVYKAIDSSLYYTDVTEKELGEITESLEGNGWKLESESDPIKHKQFGANIYRIAFVKENPLIKSQIAILVMNTKTLNTDCIIEGIGVVYCDQKSSIYKDTNNYVHIALGQYAKYEVVD